MAISRLSEPPPAQYGAVPRRRALRRAARGIEARDDFAFRYAPTKRLLMRGFSRRLAVCTSASAEMFIIFTSAFALASADEWGRMSQPLFTRTTHFMSCSSFASRERILFRHRYRVRAPIAFARVD